jgi:16S rRNA (uracil1498-N3)-methyltransferase
MQVFYTPEISGKTIILNEEESKHCVKSLRMKIGDKLQLIDGKGGFYEAKIIDNTLKACVIEIIKKEENYRQRDYFLHIAIAPTKNIDRFEWFLEKATEIGIDEISPILCERSERKLIKPERLEKIIVSAAKQSLNPFMPKLNPLISFNDFVKTVKPEQTVIAHCEMGKKPHLASVAAISSVVLIGPEGDFSPKEIDKCRKLNIKEINLGKSRLRTETAGIMACSIISICSVLNNN